MLTSELTKLDRLQKEVIQRFVGWPVSTPIGLMNIIHQRSPIWHIKGGTGRHWLKPLQW